MMLNMKYELVIWLGELGILYDVGNIFCLEFWVLWEEICYDGLKISILGILYDMIEWELYMLMIILINDIINDLSMLC